MSNQHGSCMEEFKKVWERARDHHVIITVGTPQPLKA
jgi:hypothetical protein